MTSCSRTQTSLRVAEPSDFVEACRAYVGTPFRHQGRSRAGIDCLGLVVCAARDVGIEIIDNLNYARRPDYETMNDGLLHHLRKVQQIQAGDLLWMWWMRSYQPTHLAVVAGDGNVIHACSQGAKAVVEHALPQSWQPQIVSRLRWKGW